MRRWVTLNVDWRKGLTLIGDGHCLPLRQDRADTVVCSHVLEHVRDPRQVVRELARVLKPGGTLILPVPFLFGIHSAPHDYWRFTRYGLTELVQSAALEVVEVSGQGGVFTITGDMVKRGLSYLRPTLLRWLCWLPLMPLATLLAGLEHGGSKHEAGVLVVARKRAG